MLRLIARTVAGAHAAGKWVGICGELGADATAVPILVGLDGKERMSKSKGNHIGVNDTAGEQYGKVMSLPDDVIEQFFILATNVNRSSIPEIMSRAHDDPMGVKKRLAREIVTEFHGESAAQAAQAADQNEHRQG